MSTLLASREVRWFFQGTEKNSLILKDWIEKKDPFDESCRFLEEGIWKGRLDDRPDVYVVVPSSVDMGIKWREGELQIKGRVEDAGKQVFCGRAQGQVEQWVKWSYKGAEIEKAFMRWFDRSSGEGPAIISVKKTRALRKIWIDGLGTPAEVSPKAFPDRAVNVELTDLEVLRKRYWSVGFEAFPNDSNMSAAFTQVAEAFLEKLGDIELSASNSASYPRWLDTLPRHD